LSPLLEMQRISKTSPGVKALVGVDLVVRKGEVHAVAGENGAGKSTLMKIMTGVFAADPGGRIIIDGQPIAIRDPVHARSLGISIVYQELSMVENLTVAKNIFLAREPRGRVGLIDRARMDRETAAVLDRLQLSIDPGTPVSELSIGQKQMIEIAKALSDESRLIIMDEPTASLSHHETKTLIGLIKNLRAQGIAIVYISHRLEEIVEIADRVTILRDGKTVDSLAIADVTRELLVRKMVDREISQFYGEHASTASRDVVMSVSGLSMKHAAPHQAHVENIDFDLHRGEVLGFFGLIGAGRTEIMEMIFGVRPYKGEIRIEGEAVVMRDSGDAISHGVGFVTEDRKSQGLVLGMSVCENFSLTHLSDYCAFDFVNKRREAENCREYVQTLGIKTSSINQRVVNLSGGNQQKAVIAKWVARKPRILIVDEPTRGIDVGAKAEAHSLLARLAGQGVGVIVISSDLPEVLAVSDRIIVIKDGRIGGELPRPQATQERVMAAATD
jgi:ABC-type sugar transport system ATPase subunit